MRRPLPVAVPRVAFCTATLIACLATLTILAAACLAPDRRSRSGERTGLTVLYPGDERVLGPNWDMPAKLLMFEPLVGLDAEGKRVGRLAARWEHSPDYRHWTIHLRADVRWHDGVPFTAHDVKFTLELLQHPEVLRESPGAISAAVLDDSTLALTAGTECGIDPLDPYRVYYPKHLLEDLDPARFAAWELWTRPVGNGAYRYVRHVPKTMMEFEANPDYYAGRPRIDRLVLKFGESSVLELTSGNVDVAGWVVPAEARRLAHDDRFRAYWTSAGAPRAILWNMSDPLFRDPRVRRALTHAIQRKELHGVLDFPRSLPIFDGPVSQQQLLGGDLLEPLSYDPERAARLLGEAGWKEIDGDGVREREGRTFRFELLVPGEVADAGVFIQEQLRRVGVRADVVVQPFPLIRRLWRTGGAFEAMIEFVPDRWLQPFFGKESALGYQNPRVVQLLQELECTFDPEARDRLYRQLMPIFQAEQPATFLFPMVYWFVTDRRVRGLRSPWRADPLVNLQYLWIEEEQ